MIRRNYFAIFVILSIFPIVLISTKLNSDIKIHKIFSYDYVNGIVLEVLEERIERHELYDSRFLGRQKLRIKIKEGDLKGQEFTIQNPINAERNIIAKANMKAIFTIRERNGEYSIWLYSYKKDSYIYILSAIFIALVAYLGRGKGLRSILALVYTGIIIFFVLIPLIFRAYDPIIWSIVISSYLIVTSFFLISDCNKKTLVSIIGTIGGISLAGLLAYVFGNLTKSSAIYQEHGTQILYLTADYKLKVNGLIFVSMLIASLGAIMDVAMSIASSAEELSYTIKDSEKLFKSCLNIGRDIMGTMVNTLILAFVGSSFNLLLMAWGYRMTFTQVINMPALSVEIIQALAGSIGIVFTVPFTAFVAVYFINKNLEGKK